MYLLTIDGLFAYSLAIIACGALVDFCEHVLLFRLLLFWYENDF